MAVLTIEMKKITLNGYIEEIVDDVAHCICTIKGGDATKYGSEIPVGNFDSKVTRGSIFTLTEGKKSIVVTKCEKLNEEDLKSAKKWAENMAKYINWD